MLTMCERVVIGGKEVRTRHNRHATPADFGDRCTQNMLSEAASLVAPEKTVWGNQFYRKNTAIKILRPE